MTTALTDSDCFELLADRRRRTLVRTLHEADADAALSIDDLADRIIDEEYERPTGEDRRVVRLALTHDHLPRLEDAGVVSYDRGELAVSLGSNGDDLVDFLARVADEHTGQPMDAFHTDSPSPSSRRW